MSVWRVVSVESAHAAESFERKRTHDIQFAPLILCIKAHCCAPFADSLTAFSLPHPIPSRLISSKCNIHPFRMRTTRVGPSSLTPCPTSPAPLSGFAPSTGSRTPSGTEVRQAMRVARWNDAIEALMIPMAAAHADGVACMSCTAATCSAGIIYGGTTTQLWPQAGP